VRGNQKFKKNPSKKKKKLKKIKKIQKKNYVLMDFAEREPLARGGGEASGSGTQLGAHVQGFDGIGDAVDGPIGGRRRGPRRPRRALDTPCRTVALILAVPLCIAAVAYAGKVIDAHRSSM
jgi:hypothetical protein